MAELISRSEKKAAREALAEAERKAAAEAERVTALAEVERARAAAVTIEQALAYATSLEAAEASRGVCGHVNAHYTGKDILKCVLPRAHAGHHSAPYQRLDGVEEQTFWTDAAGSPVGEVQLNHA
jgi:hypothetical protein